MLAGIRRGKFIDNLVTVSTLVLISIPIFVIGSLAQLIFGVRLGWFPVTAHQGTFYELIMPAFVLASLSLAYVARLMRTNLVENLRADYVRTAKAKGLSNTRTVGVHTLRNSLIPVITFIGIDLGALMGGAIVTERIFNINGIGNFLYRSISQKDGASVVGTITCLVLIFLLVNLLVDIFYGFWIRGSPMTDTTRPATPTRLRRSAAPLTPTGGPEAPLSGPGEGREGPVARHRRLARAPPTARCSGSRPRLIVFFVAHGGLPAAVHQHRPDPPTCPRPARRPRPTPGSVGTPGLRRLRAYHLRRPSLDPGRHLRHRVHRCSSARFVGIIAGYRGGWLDSVLSRIGEIFLGIPLLLGGILFLYVFPNDRDTRSWSWWQGGPGARRPRLADDQPG